MPSNCLKCCGNCSKYKHSIKSCSGSAENGRGGIFKESFEVCLDNWNYDGLETKHRLGEYA